MKIFNVETAELSGVNLIEASAGTGKTYNIAGIYHRLVVEKEMKPSEILVVTFTEAATSELKDRILVKLNEEYDKIKKEDNNIKNRLNLKLAINSFDEASIFTIHGFCKKVLNENAFEAESMFNFSIEKNGETIISSLVKDYWRQFFMPETPEYLEMLEQSGLNENSMISLVKEAVENPKSKIIPEYREIPEKEMFDSYNKFIEKFKTVKNIFKDEKENIYRIYCNGKIHAGKVKSDNAMEKIQKIEQFFVSGDFEMLNGKDLNAASWEYLTNNIKINVEPEKDFYNIFFVEFDKLKEEHQQSIKKINEHFSWHKHNIVKYVKNKIDFEREKRNISTFSDLIRDVWNAVEKSQNKNQNGLVDIINKKYKAVLIDEFQDTDSVQYDIFNKLFFESGKISFMIGDPKQSIYKFRGADIYSYIQAGEKAENKYTLENNYRSCPELVESVNYIFSLNPNPFKNQKIKFIKAGSKSDKVKFENQKSMEIIYVKEKSNNKDKYQDIIAEHNALEILKLLDENSNITPENIAILVRTNEQGEIIKSKLQKYGIPSVTYSETDVFETEEAEHLIKILKAAAEPLNISNLGNALCTFYIGKNHNELRKILDSENDAELVLFQEKFTLIQNCFNSFGISRAVNLFDSQFEVYQNLLQYDDFERKVTNYRHLIELIQEYSIKGRKSLENIIKWMIDRKNLKLSSEESEEKELRLESDEKAVKVITMHKSKGLQFETVFCPFFFAPASNSKAEHFKYNDTEKPGNTLINLEKIGKEMVEIEEDEENMRLFYVTLTRAVKKCVVYFPDHKDSFKTPLGYLLGLEPESDWVTDFEKAFKSNPNIDFKIIDENFEKTDKKYNRKFNQKLEILKFPEERKIDNSFRIHSYSSITHGASKNDIFEIYPDDEKNNVEIIEENIIENKLTVFDIPKGANTGNFYHEILEEIDFKIQKEELKKIVEEKSMKYSIDLKYKDVITENISDILSVELAGLGFSLKEIPEQDRVVESQFYMKAELTDGETIKKEIIKQTGVDQADLKLNIDKFRGFYTGFADLVFRKNGKYYILDWKTNYLGNKIENYSAENLKKDMIKNLYTVQHSIYRQALEKYLASRIPDYSTEKYFGGVIYLYTRGILPHQQNTWGQIVHCP